MHKDTKTDEIVLFDTINIVTVQSINRLCDTVQESLQFSHASIPH